jgi:hypothetical protein
MGSTVVNRGPGEEPACSLSAAGTSPFPLKSYGRRKSHPSLLSLARSRSTLLYSCTHASPFPFVLPSSALRETLARSTLPHCTEQRTVDVHSIEHIISKRSWTNYIHTISHFQSSRSNQSSSTTLVCYFSASKSTIDQNICWLVAWRKYSSVFMITAVTQFRVNMFSFVFFFV